MNNYPAEEFYGPGSPPRIAVVAPRNMRFSADGATSIDLHIHETVRWSQYRDMITVFAEEVINPFKDVDAQFWPKGADARSIAALVAGQVPDLIVVHQHLPTASYLSRTFPKTPVALVRHNFQKAPRNRISRFFKQRRMERLAEIAFVSECCRKDFQKNWPDVTSPVSVVLNGVDETLWQPATVKDPLILFVGRLAPEKGALEAAEAMADILREYPDWKGLMIVSTAPEHAGYAKRVEKVIAEAGGHIDLMCDVDHDTVRHWMGRASISLAPTRTQEPFGRVAVEALASGTVPIASARGGFVEIVGESGILLDTPDRPSLSVAMKNLIGDEGKRLRLAVAGRERVVPRYTLATAAATFDALVGRHCVREVTP